MMEAVSNSETSVNSYEATRRSISEVRRLSQSDCETVTQSILSRSGSPVIAISLSQSVSVIHSGSPSLFSPVSLSFSQVAGTSLDSGSVFLHSSSERVNLLN
jgi:hypothetical protein